MKRALAVAVGVAVLAAPGTASAHSPSDFLKVPVGRAGSVLLPPMVVPAGAAQVTITSPHGFHLLAANGGAGWATELAPGQAMLTNAHTPAGAVLVTVTGTASRPGRFRLHVSLTSGTQSRRESSPVLTAAAGYSRPVDAMSSASRPDPAVAGTTAGLSARVPWPVSLALAFAAVALLAVRRSRRT